MMETQQSIYFVISKYTLGFSDIFVVDYITVDETLLTPGLVDNSLLHYSLFHHG